MKLFDLAGDEDDRKTSPYCWRIRLALAHKKLDFYSVPWRAEEKDMIAFSGQGRVTNHHTCTASFATGVCKQAHVCICSRYLCWLMVIQLLWIRGA